MENKLKETQVLKDLILSGRHIASRYNFYVDEGVSAELRNDLMNILNEEHQITSDLISALEDRSWS